MGSYRKRIQLLNPLGGHEFWVEGIGSSNGLLYSGQATWDEGTLLMCFHENDTLTYLNPEYNDCTYSTVGLNTLELGYGVSLYPNPSNGNFVVAFKHAPEGSFEIIDIAGRVHRGAELNGALNYPVEGLGSGIYFVRVQYPSGLSEVKRVIVEL